MSNIALAWVNLADLGTITASGFITLGTPALLQNKHVNRKWRENVSTSYVLCDLGSLQSLDTVALIGLGGVTLPTLRVRVSTADATGAAGDAYDSTALNGLWDSNYLPFVRLITAPVTGRYVRIDITQISPSASYIEAGRLFVGLRQQFTINFQANWERQWNDASVRTIGRSGLSFDDIRSKYRTLNLTLDFVTDTERWAYIEAIDIALGSHGDMLVITDPASTNLSRDCVWGYMEAMSPVIQPLVIATNTSIFRKTYQVRERL